MRYETNMALRHYGYFDTSEELMHYGVAGQKWGVRRYQNEDGTLTAEGRSRLEALRKYRGRGVSNVVEPGITREQRLMRKIQKANASGRLNRKARLEKKLEAQQKANDDAKKWTETNEDKINRSERHIGRPSFTKTPSISLNKKSISTEYRFNSGESQKRALRLYNKSRARGASAVRAFYETYLPGGTLLRAIGNKRKYGKALVYSAIDDNEPWSDSDRNSLEHFGIKGQKWGIRRFQNEDGSLTDEGKRRYLQNGGYNGNTNLNLRGMFRVNGFKYGAYLRKQSPYARKDGETKEEQKARIKEWEEAENKKFDEMTEKENELRDLGKRMDSFDTASTDEKFKILDEVLKKNWELVRAGGHDNEKMHDGLMDWYWQNYGKAGKARFDEYNSLPQGPERDQKLTQLLGDSADHGQDSEYVNALIDHMQKTSGDYLSREFKTEAARKSADAVDDASDEEKSVLDNYFKQDVKSGRIKAAKGYDSGWFHRDELAANHPEVKQAIEKREAAWEKYCEQVLKDMGMPVNDKTIEYIQSVIIWN